ncbi:DUF742 domain-containing protein [Streptomyces sp. NPDC049887]|uniref:DUF742 domain-containing protein n=1 Tax=Streptomyces TaxID=1883 RepID=UPI003419705B
MSRHSAQPGDATAHTSGRLVRPFTLIGGRTRPKLDVFSLITLITATKVPEARQVRALSPEHRQILRLCAEPRAVAEVAAHLDLPVSVIAIMLSDLLDESLITAHPPVSMPRSAGIDLLRRLRDGLARL